MSGAGLRLLDLGGTVGVAQFGDRQFQAAWTSLDRTQSSAFIFIREWVPKPCELRGFRGSAVQAFSGPELRLRVLGCWRLSAQGVSLHILGQEKAATPNPWIRGPTEVGLAMQSVLVQLQFDCEASRESWEWFGFCAAGILQAVASVGSVLVRVSLLSRLGST